MKKIITEIKNHKIAYVIFFFLIFFILCLKYRFVYVQFYENLNFIKELEKEEQLINIVILIIPLLLLIFISIRFFSFINKIKHQLVLGLIIFFFLILINYHIYDNGWKNFLDEFEETESPFYLVNIAIALAALATATFTWWKNNLNQRMSFSQEGTRQDNLFVEAIELIKENNDLITRKGGVHVLKELGKTSPEQAHKCIDILCSLNESWMPTMLDINPNFFKDNKGFINLKDFKNIKMKRSNAKDDKDKLYKQMYLSQLVLQSLSEIFKHISENSNFKGPFNLSNKYLCAINLENLDFKNKFKIYNANLQFANLQSTDINGVDFTSADLLGAVFLNAKNIDKAKFDNNKKDAIFTYEDYKKHYPDK